MFEAAATPVLNAEVVPSLPDGVVYLDDRMNVTRTDISKVPEGALVFQPEYAGYGTPRGLTNYDGFLIYSYRPGEGGTYVNSINPVSQYRRSRDEFDYISHHRNDIIKAHMHIYALPAGHNIYDFEQSLADFVRKSPWHKCETIMHHPEIWIEHIPVRSEKMPGMLAYYQSPEKRARGIRTPIKPGKYLQKFFSHLLTAEEIHDLGVSWATWSSPPKLTITQDADLIEKAYRSAYNGSCMFFEDGGWSGECHPARIYAGPDLALAFIGDPDSFGGISARVLCWPERKQFINKMYGDDRRLTEALLAEGYTKVDRCRFEGARAVRIEGRHDKLTAPYLDFGGYLAQNDGDEFLTIVDEDAAEGYDSFWACGNTNGLSDGRCKGRGVDCEITGERFDPDEEGAFVDGTGWVSDRGLERAFVWSDHEDRYIHNDDAVYVHRVGHVSDNAFNSDPEYYTCFLSGDNFTTDYDDKVELGDSLGEYAAEHNLTAYGYEVCEHDGLAYPSREMIDVKDLLETRRVHQSNADHYAIEETTDIAA